jgi:hypothetical protein
MTATGEFILGYRRLFRNSLKEVEPYSKSNIVRVYII